MAIAVEVCVTSVEEAVAAQALGADSVEVCSWLACGGITPSSGLVDSIRVAVSIHVRVLIRTTPAGFVYTPAESRVLLTDAEVFGGGALSLVTGALTASGDLDQTLMRSVKEVAPESEVTFHRAIDVALDPIRIVDQCLALGIDRVLTSGGRTSAMDGIAGIKAIMTRCNGQFQVAIGGGVNPKNVVELVERTGAQEVHFSAQRALHRPQAGAAMSASSAGFDFGTEPDIAKIEGVLNELVKAGLR
ncbi:MAG: hypothetical protein KBA60_04695 [Flavobacteriales bacterium]|nr:hypothetical protein [Flavobacteriales bacterium]MBP7155283.1 hypothetical protein [Flavobacteriales bacterium]HQV76591.1 copper homeostasis protein CutC [Flavobacteriales bacterium]HQW42184.1 copper homeostasis protein CutC [Flavobacteriales bacterium]